MTGEVINKDLNFIQHPDHKRVTKFALSLRFSFFKLMPTSTMGAINEITFR